MEHVTAPDGTRIAFRTGGHGEPVLFVHGALAASSDWIFVARLLRDRYTVVTMDRRGRGASEAGAEPYAIDREAEDVAAVAAATGARAVVAHSYGALCTMRALAAGLDLDRVVLYEPPVSAAREVGGRQAELAEHLRAGRADEAAGVFLSLADATDDELALVRASPAWPAILAAVPSLGRELAEVGRWTTPAGPFDLPALLLLGGDTTSESYLAGVPAVEAAFPRLVRRELPDQRHLGHVLSADAFAATVADFLRD